MSTRKIEAFLRKQCSIVQSEGSLARIVLFQVQAGRNAIRLEEWQFSDDVPCVPDEVAVEIYEAAADDAETLAGGLQRYVIRAYYGESLEPGAHKSFTAGKRLLQDDDMGGMEPATPSGQRAQAMRHTEGLHALVLRGMGGVVDGMRRDLHEQRQHTLEQQRLLWEQEKELRDLRRKDREEELTYAEHDLRLQQMKTVYGIGMALVPPLLEKLTGAKHEGPSVAEAAIKAFLRDLDPAERMGIFESLNDGNKVRLAELLRSFDEREKQDDTGKKQVKH